MNHANEYLFVYGTLLRQSQSPMSALLLSNSRILDKAVIRGSLFDIGDYPGLVLAEKSKSKVMGEVFNLNNPDALFKKLDDYEGSEYRRVKAAIKLESGESLQAWVYEFSLPTDSYSRIESGDYMAYLGLALT